MSWTRMTAEERIDDVICQHCSVQAYVHRCRYEVARAGSYCVVRFAVIVDSVL